MNILLAGYGRMGQALVAGWRAAGLLGRAIETVTVVEPDTARHGTTAGLTFVTAPPPGATPDVVLFAVKPQMIDNVLPHYVAYAPQALYLSILAGTPLATLAAPLADSTPVIRCMPNTPAAIGQGMTACIGNAHVTDAHRTTAQTLLEAAGAVVWLETEDQMHAVTALSGSGPAYVFYLTEVLAACGETLGLAPDLAATLARQTVTGSSALMAAAPESPATLRENVTSPGGTTAAALSVLRDTQALQDLFTTALQAAAHRSQELG